MAHDKDAARLVDNPALNRRYVHTLQFMQKALPPDPWGRHFHEFEDWQFDWLLEKAGGRVVRSEKWTSPSRVLGFRPLLRRITPRYYAVEAERV